jgi:hypothetical protein
MENFDLRKYLAEGKLLKEEYNLPDSDSTTDQYVNNHWDGILKDILRAHTDLRNSKGGESILEKPSQLDIDIVLGRFDGADEFMDVDPNVYDEYFDFYDMYLVTQRDEENTKSISDEDYPKGNYDGYTKRDDLPKLSEGKLLKENAPGYDTRKQGEALPTLESVKAAYEAKNDIKEATAEFDIDNSENLFDSEEMMQDLSSLLSPIEDIIINKAIKSTVGEDSDDDIDVSDFVQGELAMMYGKITKSLENSLNNILKKTIEEFGSDLN